jgi:hypothetical protein
MSKKSNPPRFMRFSVKFNLQFVFWFHVKGFKSAPCQGQANEQNYVKPFREMEQNPGCTYLSAFPVKFEIRVILYSY